MANETELKVKKGSIGLYRFTESATFMINPYKHIPGKRGYVFAVVTSATREGKGKTASRGRNAEGYSRLTGCPAFVLPAERLQGKGAELVEALTGLYETLEAARDAAKAFIDA